MSDLSQVIIDILKREGADKRMILGARLGALVRDQHDEILRRAMSERAVKFVQLVQDIPGVQVVRDPAAGLDVLIGLKGSAPPPPRGGALFLRQDVFAAFTRAGVQHSYDPASDEFHEGLPREGGVQCPDIRPSEPAEMRAEFASTVADPEGGELRAALDGQAGSLTRFREAMLRLGLAPRWERFRYEALSGSIREWAATTGIDVQPSWFRRAGATQRRLRPRELLADVARVMTDEEARSVLVSVGAVERYLSSGRQGPPS